MTDEIDFTRFVAAVENEVGPLDRLSRKSLAPGMDESDALRIFLAANAAECPTIVHLPEYGMKDLDLLRRFLTAYAGQTITLPSGRTLARKWLDFKVWMAVRAAEKSSGREDAVRLIMKRYKISRKRMVRALGTFDSVALALDL